MKVKKVKIGIKTTREFLDEARDVMERAIKGEKVKKTTGVYFENLSDMRKILTEKRLEALKTIKDKKPESIYRLAKILHRDIKNVIQDLEYLHNLGLVELKETEKKTIPKVNYEKILLEIAV
ncbi:MAG: hypothetical protein HY754_09185 [Nitrospirae bacterium]|nr:hypothetical protein [Nitrospirota bacterium]